MPIHGLPPSSAPSKPAHFDIEKVIRPNILALHPYRCARDDYQSGVLLDANENALGHSIPESPSLEGVLSPGLNRYPDPNLVPIKQRIADLRGLPAPNYVFLGVGSDEAVDLLMRVCVTPEKEKILVTPPTYGMYGVSAQVNDIGVVKCNLRINGSGGEGGETGRFSVRVDEMKKCIDADPSIKLIFLTSPGNPTGTLISLSAIRALLDYEPFKGIVIVDEAYIDFASEGASAVSLVKEYANICVLQTLSKSFGLASIRIGIAIAQPPLIQVLSNTKAPYNISGPSAALAAAALEPAAVSAMRTQITNIIRFRASLLAGIASDSLKALGLGTPIGAPDANFVLVPILGKDGEPDNVRAQEVYRRMAENEGVVVRFRGGEIGCKGCLRITVGSEEENVEVLRALGKVLAEV
ncbi:hypothetical protein PLICRDRAFT_105654 [Plicaturopsis crispa FD-325 SS-3]|nr:hypothetical protein PLICRDRAFT_105654 [Plicaturopsis crispa FD-325 SS-3]